ncbi:hypothetical protein OAN96_01590, partial [Candidatus Gracilibacteria bacterium]|nr:hypothetical protein [Candidatus Gracilibacteria bacterium]
MPFDKNVKPDELADAYTIEELSSLTKLYERSDELGLGDCSLEIRLLGEAVLMRTNSLFYMVHVYDRKCEQAFLDHVGVELYRRIGNNFSKILDWQDTCEGECVSMEMAIARLKKDQVDSVVTGKEWAKNFGIPEDDFCDNYDPNQEYASLSRSCLTDEQIKQL